MQVFPNNYYHLAMPRWMMMVETKKRKTPPWQEARPEPLDGFNNFFPAKKTSNSIKMTINVHTRRPRALASPTCSHFSGPPASPNWSGESSSPSAGIGILKSFCPQRRWPGVQDFWSCWIKGVRCLLQHYSGRAREVPQQKEDKETEMADAIRRERTALNSPFSIRPFFTPFSPATVFPPFLPISRKLGFVVWGDCQTRYKSASPPAFRSSTPAELLGDPASLTPMIILLLFAAGGAQPWQAWLP